MAVSQGLSFGSWGDTLFAMVYLMYVSIKRVCGGGREQVEYGLQYMGSPVDGPGISVPHVGGCFGSPLAPLGAEYSSSNT